MNNDVNIRYTTQFKKDYKRISQSGIYDINKLQDIVEKLLQNKKLPIKNKDHPLKGKMSGFRECHVSPDWLLIYQYSGFDLLLIRTGSHSELFC